MPVSAGRERRRLRLMLIVALVVAAVAGALIAHAAPIDVAAPFDAWTQAVQDLQRRFHAELATAIRAVKANESLALWNLIGLGFLYGVFHAAGPGHGKFVISTYLATSGAGLGRGISLTAASACLQGLTAIAVVELTVGVLNLTFRDARQNAAWVETASYALVALLGLTIAALALRRVWRRRRRPGSSGTHHQSHDQSHDQSRDHGHDHHEHRGHAHGLAANDLAQPLSPARFATIVLSVGIRPCTGAVLVLLFAHALELRLAGIGAVAGMSLGTALTVSTLAVLAVYARRTALKLAAFSNAPGARLAMVLNLVAATGGGIIAATGLSLLAAALQTQRHPLF